MCSSSEHAVKVMLAHTQVNVTPCVGHASVLTTCKEGALQELKQAAWQLRASSRHACCKVAMALSAQDAGNYTSTSVATGATGLLRMDCTDLGRGQLFGGLEPCLLSMPLMRERRCGMGKL